jgi:ATP-dependent RNA helicase DDX47/RRP3
VDTLIQQYVFIPAKFKDCYLTYILNEMAGAWPHPTAGSAVVAEVWQATRWLCLCIRATARSGWR